MNASLQEILVAIDKRVMQPASTANELITSGRYSSDWLQDRIRYNHQILINAFISSASSLSYNLDVMKADIVKEFERVAGINVQPIPFPYDDVDVMRQTVVELIYRYGASLSVDDVVQNYDKKHPLEDVKGYLVVTVILTPVIV